MNDLTFFTNEKGRRLIDRFKTLFKDTKELDIIVGYFYLSGLYELQDELEKVDRIRIIVGMQVGKEVFNLLERAKNISDLKEEYLNNVVVELSSGEYEDFPERERAIRKFIDWIREGKLEIRYYPHSPLHAKVYIFKSRTGIDLGRVITGSSNFTFSGLKENLEFNVELKNRADVEFAIDRFESLWRESVEISEEVVKTVREKTWLNDTISPYELYLKFLYEFLYDQIDYDKKDEFLFLPPGFKKLQYQLEAVVDAESKLKRYGGVFLSDVVGLGKTVIAAMLTAKLRKKVLVFSPPHLIDYWEDVLREFRVPAKVISSGRLSRLSPKEFEDYPVVIVDEAHRFRNEDTQSYKNLHSICQGKEVILLTATPYNNRPSDIKSQLLLFQERYSSNIPGVTNLEDFFSQLERRIKEVDRKKDPKRFKEVLKECGKEIRSKILTYVMVRRTRKEVEKYFKEDLKTQKVSFPRINPPKRIYYLLDRELEKLYDETIETIKDLSYARYRPALYLKKKLKSNDPELLSQMNLSGLMKTLLLKRLESSFEAFKRSLDRFLDSHEKFLRMFEEKGKVYVSKEVDVYQLLDEDNLEELLELVEKGKVKEYKKEELSKEFEENLRSDTEKIRLLRNRWYGIEKDPKLEEFLKLLKKDSVLKNSKKLLIFTESSETADYVGEKLKETFGDCVLIYSSKSKSSLREEIISNFDPNAKRKEDNIRFLVTTDVLAEGINLHRSNVIVNYDIPWNPTRVLQRVGRINRVGTEFKEIYIYNFFPVGATEKEIGLEAAAVAKLQAFHEALGEDAKYLTEEEEVDAHGLFERINTIEEDEEESFLKYVKLLRKIREEEPELFERIKKLPKKARSGRRFKREFLITLFKKGKLKKIYISYRDREPQEIDFLKAVELLETEPSEKRVKIPDTVYYELLNKNRKAFEKSLEREREKSRSRKSFSRTEKNLINSLRALKSSLKNSSEKESVQKLLDAVINGSVPKGALKDLSKKLNEAKTLNERKKVLIDFIDNFPLEEKKRRENFDSPLEVIISQYFGNC
ncbi:SNF2 family N-terminal domain-containing protein [Balnearium lithotrophicum]|uniref:SNF2 family N-terminal domain-containing protein n=1 Tax=Balnearium lithotrophicum TaxID=223788 RepID=A0A521ACA7_9BACT|nr:helicase-related protein [Balnearium lithotrophicum]SMO32425.1 SNF2 family N-terminal domain-containing protein [Balnearium lithotrophicum]